MAYTWTHLYPNYYERLQAMAFECFLHECDMEHGHFPFNMES
jgi:hypothetical protein